MRRISLLLVSLAALSACSENYPSPDPCADGRCDDAPAAFDAPEELAPRDVAVDVRAPDASADAPEDLARDATSDVADSAPDVGIDAVSDATTDAAPDVAPDATPDVALDVVMDASPDVTLDAAVDVARDAAMDLPSPDVRDAAVDTGVDVRPDLVAPVDGAPAGGCVSGALGTHVARFRWTGSGSGTRASVSYEANTLPDHARWRVTANSRSIGYTPVFDDPFLGEGGLSLSGTTFIDVELSTAGLSGLSGVSLAIYGRSFNTTASGSFAWQTFSGTGASPSGSVFNSAPYRWYRADASRAFVAGDGSVLLRITAGPPSGSLIVNRVEICFNAR